ncbi:MAG: Smr/MutS family protein [Cytophagaceae bacterium]|jgi:hypothetical protein|nr:Smr/MutS family protein [Cytophagaceae bacterium]
MKIGDNVRLVHGKESGKITRILSAYEVEVEIEDGFRIPVATREVALISSDERKLTQANEPISTSSVSDSIPNEVLSGHITIAFKAFNDSIYQVFLLNERTIPFHYIVFYKKNTAYLRHHSGTLEPGQSICIEERAIQQFSTWPVAYIQVMYLPTQVSELLSPQLFEVACKADKFYQNRKDHPILGKNIHFWSIDTKIAKDAFTIKEALIDNMSSAMVQTIVEEPSYETDLHIEKLDENWASLSPAQMLQRQVSAFETTLENAVAVNMEELIFIHGVGNKTLQKEIHKRLAKDPRIDFFKDAAKERFGYGATLVRLK